MRRAIIAMTVFATTLTACGSNDAGLTGTVETFRAARKAGNYEEAKRYLVEDPRVWYEAKEGEGIPFVLGAGKYEAWDEHFNSKGETGPWTVEGRTVWAVATEINDYYRLVEREDTPTYRVSYFFDDDGLIEGYMISAAYPDRPSPPRISREEEFKTWAAKTHPEEWAYLRPGGKLDPTGDRAPRTRALLEEWRETVGLPPIALAE